MKSMRALTLIAFVSTLGFVAGCDKSSSMPGQRISMLNPSSTLGNHSYISIESSYRPSQIVHEILAILDRFEKEHPDLEITSWNIQEGQYYKYIHGLWVNHRPKSK